MRARGHTGADRTIYGSLPTSPQSFLTHHIQKITRAAVYYDAKAILKAVDFRKAVAVRSQGAPSHAASPTSANADSDSDGKVGGAWA